MKLFHGTSLEFGNEILKTGLIKKNQQPYDSVTDPNFVYLSDRITSAMVYGHKKTKREKEFYIFEVELEEGTLLVDLDEVDVFKDSPWGPGNAIRSLNGNYTVVNTLPHLHSVRVDKDIDLKLVSGKYAKVSTVGIVNIYKADSQDFHLTDEELAKIYNSFVWKKY
ncbi:MULTISPECIES: hypothetical protein [Bacillus cereus group]|uniref:hypothetical protein n=1 Tax=Bacillus cereus group TaxID=86661 RepID=UPI0005E978AF|nr:hypothetical protein [Bacillus paranthracis]CKE81945.1 Uncharacterised protein [Streptococcus pneumoniae]CKF43739.1 Uncharacterised protein [Streptococcus pneumoniae]CKF87447.1 Uncharacterised protein [Streptococcus pneumoniae]CKF95161.1 Uncharacterised protein [Bacillus paranthracis]